MKKKLFSLLVLVMTAMTASAFDLKAGTNEHGTIAFTVGGNAATTANEGDEVTVTVTAREGYVLNEVSGQWVAAEAKAPGRRTIDMVQDITLTFVSEDATTKARTYTFEMIRANVEISAAYKKLMTNMDITIDPIDDVTYNGQPQTPTVTVKDGSAVLVKDVDYTVAYSNNTNAALATAAQNAPTVTITAVAESDNYAGETTKTFTIGKATLTATADDKSRAYGEANPDLTVTVTGFVNGETAATAAGYTAPTATTAATTETAVGSYDITASGGEAANYTFSYEKGTLTIGKATGRLSFAQRYVYKTYGDDDFTVTPSKTGDGTVTYTLSNTDYATVDEDGKVHIVYPTQTYGYLTVTATMAEGTNYTGATASYNLYIYGINLSYATVALATTSYDYDGTAKEPDVLAVVLDGKLLAEGTDYYVDYDDNVNAGKATAYVYGYGLYEGTASADFTIRPVTTTDGNVTVEDGGDETALTIQDMGNQQGSTVKEDLVVTTLTYNRTLNESDRSAYTVCLPYAPPTDSDLKYYTLTGADGTTLQFDEISGAPQAYTPYLVFASATTDIGTKDLHENIVMKKEVDNSSTGGIYQLKGTLSGIKHDDAVGLYILQSGNRWAVVGDDTHAYIPPFRAYIVATGSAPERLDSSFDGNTTGIRNIRTVDQDGTERWFDLNGRRMAAPQKGLYINNGRKMIKK